MGAGPPVPAARWRSPITSSPRARSELRDERPRVGRGCRARGCRRDASCCLLRQVHGAHCRVSQRRGATVGTWTPPQADGVVSDDPSAAIGGAGRRLRADPDRRSAHGCRGRRPRRLARHACSGIGAEAVAAMAREFGSDPARSGRRDRPLPRAVLRRSGRGGRAGVPRGRPRRCHGSPAGSRATTAGARTSICGARTRDQLEAAGIPAGSIHVAGLCTGRTRRSSIPTGCAEPRQGGWLA